MKPLRFLLSLLLALTATTLSVVFASAGNDFIIGNLRVDIPEVYNSGRYRVLLYAGDRPTTGNQNDFSTGWIGVYLHELPYLWVLFLKHSRAIFQRFFAQPALVCLGLDGLTLQSTLMVTRTHR